MTPATIAGYAINTTPLAGILDAVIRAKLFGKSDPVKINAADIERDGRRRATVMRELTAAGILDKATTPQWWTVNVEFLWIALGELNLPRPTLDDLAQIQTADIAERNAPVGRAFKDLPREQQIAALLAPDQYLWRWTENWTRQPAIVWTPGTPMPDVRHVHEWTLQLSTVETDTTVAARVRDYRINKAMTSSFRPGLQKLLSVTEDETLAFGRAAGNWNQTMPEDVSAWGAEATDRLDRAQAKVTRAIAELVAVTKIHALVTARGGWATFAEELRGAIAQTIDRRNAEETKR